jgi:hypothetical protein
MYPITKKGDDIHNEGRYVHAMNISTVTKKSTQLTATHTLVRYIKIIVSEGPKGWGSKRNMETPRSYVKSDRIKTIEASR